MILFGFDQGVMGGLITAPGFKQEIFGTQNPASGISGCVVAIYDVGAFIGALTVLGFGMWSANVYRSQAKSNYAAGQRLGRKKTTAVGQAITIIGAILQATSYGLGQIITGRVVTGLGVGILTATVPVWTVSFIHHRDAP
jgi:MFS family permease